MVLKIKTPYFILSIYEMFTIMYSGYFFWVYNTQSFFLKLVTSIFIYLYRQHIILYRQHIKKQRHYFANKGLSSNFIGNRWETVETVADFIWGGSKITADGDCSHEIKRCLLLGRKVMTNLDSIFKSRDITY